MKCITRQMISEWMCILSLLPVTAGPPGFTAVTCSQSPLWFGLLLKLRTAAEYELKGERDDCCACFRSCWSADIAGYAQEQGNQVYFHHSGSTGYRVCVNLIHNVETFQSELEKKKKQQIFFSSVIALQSHLRIVTISLWQIVQSVIFI